MLTRPMASGTRRWPAVGPRAGRPVATADTLASRPSRTDPAGGRSPCAASLRGNPPPRDCGPAAHAVVYHDVKGRVVGREVRPRHRPVEGAFACPRFHRLLAARLWPFAEENRCKTRA